MHSLMILFSNLFSNELDEDISSVVSLSRSYKPSSTNEQIETRYAMFSDLIMKPFIVQSFQDRNSVVYFNHSGSHKVTPSELPGLTVI